MCSWAKSMVVAIDHSNYPVRLRPSYQTLNLIHPNGMDPNLKRWRFRSRERLMRNNESGIGTRPDAAIAYRVFMVAREPDPDGLDRGERDLSGRLAPALDPGGDD